MPTRTREADRALCLHEAAHAVVGEALSPGIVALVEMDYEPGKPDGYWGFVYGGGVDALCHWVRIWSNYDPDNWVATAAGREGEKIEPDPDFRYDAGDQAQIREWVPPWTRRRIRRRAASLVRTHELAIRRVAKALASERVLTGDEIRRLIAA